MMSELIHIESMQINSFIWHCVCGNGRMVISINDANKVVMDNGKYIVKISGKYVTQKNFQQLALCEIIKRMIDKHNRFQYDGYLYHSPELNMWIKEEI